MEQSHFDSKRLVSNVSLKQIISNIQLDLLQIPGVEEITENVLSNLQITSEKYNGLIIKPVITNTLSSVIDVISTNNLDITALENITLDYIIFTVANDSDNEGNDCISLNNISLIDWIVMNLMSEKQITADTLLSEQVWNLDYYINNN